MILAMLYLMNVFEKIVALIRVSAPYAGMIMSTRETQEMRERGLALGIPKSVAALVLV